MIKWDSPASHSSSWSASPFCHLLLASAARTLSGGIQWLHSSARDSINILACSPLDTQTGRTYSRFLRRLSKSRISAVVGRGRTWSFRISSTFQNPWSWSALISSSPGFPWCSCGCVAVLEARRCRNWSRLLSNGADLGWSCLSFRSPDCHRRLRRKAGRSCCSFDFQPRRWLLSPGSCSQAFVVRCSLAFSSPISLVCPGFPALLEPHQPLLGPSRCFCRRGHRRLEIDLPPRSCGKHRCRGRRCCWFRTTCRCLWPLVRTWWFDDPRWGPWCCQRGFDGFLGPSSSYSWCCWKEPKQSIWSLDSSRWNYLLNRACVRWTCLDQAQNRIAPYCYIQLDHYLGILGQEHSCLQI